MKWTFLFIIHSFMCFVMVDFAIYVSPFFLVPAGIFLYYAIKFRPRKHVDPPIHNHTDYSSGGYEGHTLGDIVDLGGGNQVDLRNPGSVMSQMNWHQDCFGDYYNSATGETITYNNGRYSYDDGNDDSDY